MQNKMSLLTTGGVLFHLATHRTWWFIFSWPLYTVFESSWPKIVKPENLRPHFLSELLDTSYLKKIIVCLNLENRKHLSTLSLQLWVVVHSLKQKKELYMLRLWKQIHGHSSDGPEWRSVDSVRGSSAQAEDKNKKSSRKQAVYL